MIKKITIRDIATFDKEGIVMDDLQKVNIIYGGNGAGKTTTSRVLEYGYAPRGYKQTADTTIVKPWKYPTCEVDWDGEPARVLVYNKDFREESLKETLPGVYTLGDRKMAKDARMMLGYDPIQPFGKFSLLMPNKNLDKVNEEYEQIEERLRDRLWLEVYMPHKDQRKLLGPFNRKETFAAHIRELLKRKREGDMFWEVEGNNKTRLWKELALKSEAMVEKAEAELASLRKAIKECQRIYDQLVEDSKKQKKPANEIEDTSGVVKSGLDSVNEALRLNGFTGFSIQPSAEKHGEFQIQREDGSYVRNTLSEGEATIITFLYFIQMVEGNIGGESSDGKKVVVIDDPICSLDYTSIALVSTLTNALIEKARKGENGIEQVFVLTHNTSFHKQISVEQPKNKASYWKLYKKNGVSSVAAFGGANPVRNDYQAMWDKLLDEGTDEAGVEKANLMRRIIETYFLQYGGMDWEQLYGGEQMVDWDMEKFRGIFEKMGHLSHYEMVVRGK